MDLNTKQDKLIHRINRAYGCFLQWKYIKKSFSIPEIGEKEAKRRSEIMNNYGGIFSGFLYSLESSFIVDLHKFFDKSKKKLTLRTLMKDLPDNEKKEIELLTKDIEKECSRIETLRHNTFAHEPKSQQEEKIFLQEIEKIFDVIQKILNIISKYLNGPNLDWDSWENNTEESFSQLIDDLERGSSLKQ